MTEAVERKIESLLRMADGMANEHESANALQLAQKLADAHNLDLGQIGKSGSRKDEQVSKGLYKYQRTLYTELADINHCKVWISKGLRKGSKYQTRLLGSKVNVTTIKVMADYVEEVANRMVRDRYPSNKYFSADAHLFREGFVDTMVDRIRSKREAEERAREVEKREQEARSRHPGAATENAIVLISDVAREEEKANYDYLNGEGAWDRREQRRLEAAERSRAAIAEYEAWALAHPEEAKAKTEAQEAEYKKWVEDGQKREARLKAAAEKRRAERIAKHGYDPLDFKDSKPTKYDSDAYWQGRDDARTVNLDEQIEEEERIALS